MTPKNIYYYACITLGMSCGDACFCVSIKETITKKYEMTGFWSFRAWPLDFLFTTLGTSHKFIFVSKKLTLVEMGLNQKSM